MEQMSLTIELSPEQEEALRTQAAARGLTVQEWLLQLAAERGPVETDLPGAQREPFWKVFLERVHSLPPEAFEGLPTDGASEHDHYLYGSPKRNQ
jgi:hypothetical protein